MSSVVNPYERSTHGPIGEHTALAWQKELGEVVSINGEFPEVARAFRDQPRHVQDTRRTMMVKPTKDQMKVESMFPAIAKYVKGYGYVEIGDQESFGFVVRALGYGGLDFEDNTPETLAEAMAVLEAGLTRLVQEQGAKLDNPRL